MTADQRERVVRYLGNGAKLREAADMVGAAWSDFAEDWTSGRKDSEAGRDSDVATFYRDARAARSRNIAEKRAEAAAAAGSRVSADLLAYVRQLESEEEPLAAADDEEPTTAPRLVTHPDPKVRAAALAQLDASRKLLRALTAAAS